MIIFLGRYLIGVLECHQTGKKRVWRVCDHYYDQKKKGFSRPSGGCAIIIMTGKKKSCCLSGIIKTGKKSSSRQSGGCAIAITTGKKKVQVVCLAGA